MQSYLKWVAAALVAAPMFYSCSDELPGQSGASATRGQITARIAEPAATRTAVDDAVEGTNAVGIVWTDGDELGVFDATGTAQKRYAKVGQGAAATATFAAADAEPFATPVYAYYPYGGANDGRDVNSLTGTLPATQPMDGSTTLHGDYKYGRATTATADGGYEFEFRHLFSLGRFVIDATGTPLAGESLRSLTVSVSRSGEGVPIAGDFTFSAVDGDWSMTGEGQSSVTLQWNEQAPTLGEPYTCYMSMFPNVRMGDQFTITVTTDGHRAYFTATSLTAFSPEQIYTFPLTLDNYESLQVEDSEGQAVRGRFTCAALNVDGLPQLINSGGPGADGTARLGSIMNRLGYDFIAVSEDFDYHDELASAMSDYNVGLHRDVSFWNIAGKNDTDGLCFFWKKDGITATGETIVEFNDSFGGLDAGANTLIAKGFRHYVVTVASGVEIDVYITHMNTYGENSTNTEEDGHYHAQLQQLRQIREYVVEQALANNRPAIIMGDTNMRYTRHQIVENLIDPVTSEGLQIADPWIDLHRGGVYPTWNTRSLMIQSKFAGDNENDILCIDDQRGEVVDKMWYINVPTAPVQLTAVSSMNNVEDFATGTEQVSYSGVTVEQADGTLLYDQQVNITRVNGIADHFPVVTTFEYTRSGGN